MDWDDEFDDEDYELSPDELADIKRSVQDIDAGYFYTSSRCEEDGTWIIECNKCKRKAPMLERPFPHKLYCPMRKAE